MTKVIKIPIVGGNVALVDPSDAPLMREYKWHMGGHLSKYAKTSVGKSGVFMHRLIMDPPANMDVDHINGDPLDNRRANLRLATRSQNAANRTYTNSGTGYKGVYYYPSRERYQGTVRADGGRYRGPYRESAEDAARDHDALARGLFGAFATVNFPGPGERGVIPRHPEARTEKRGERKA
tara:strand:+ start:76 stop:615 length:540 start_codon:yes stop_codon:yes gene_type:complete